MEPDDLIEEEEGVVEEEGNNFYNAYFWLEIFSMYIHIMNKKYLKYHFFIKYSNLSISKKNQWDLPNTNSPERPYPEVRKRIFSNE